MNDTESNNPTHLFISYADEDVVLAKLLARKLASFGYAVWFDQLKMLGGEPWPQTIDDAIKNRTFRMLALMSAHSVHKPNPTKERTLALRIAKQRNIPDFLITLKLDKVELDWLTTDISYIAFDRSWANGLRQLIKKLDSISAPKTLTNGAAIAASTLSLGDDLCESRTEKLRANVLRVQTIPDVLTAFEIVNPLTEEQGSRLDTRWAYYRINNSVAIAFRHPGEEYRQLIKPTGEQWSWTNCEKVRGIRSRDIVVNLIVRTIQVMLLQASCRMHPKRLGIFYLPEDFTKDGRLRFIDFRGKKTWLKIRGKATFWRPGKPKELNFHHFAFQLKLGRGLDSSFWIQVTPSLFFFDEGGNPIVDNRVGPRRRRLTKNWWNAKWLNRLLAAEQLLVSLRVDTEGSVVLDKALLTLSSPITLNEAKLGNAEPTEKTEDPNVEEGQVIMEDDHDTGDDSDE